MEWWENDYGYDPVSEADMGYNSKNFAIGANTDNGKVNFNMRTGSGLASRTRTASVKQSTLRNAGIGAAALGAGAALKYGVSKYRANKAKKAAAAAAQNQPAPPTQPAHIKGSANTQRGGYSEFEGNGRVREDWEYFDDPGAQMILESYFSEFGDADVFGGPEPEYDNYNEEWDY